MIIILNLISVLNLYILNIRILIDTTYTLIETNAVINLEQIKYQDTVIILL